MLQNPTVHISASQGSWKLMSWFILLKWNTEALVPTSTFVKAETPSSGTWPSILWLKCQILGIIWWSVFGLSYGAACSCETLINLCRTTRCHIPDKKLSRCRPGQALGVPESSGSRNFRQSAHEGGKVVSPTRRPSLPPGRIPGTHFC